MGGDFVTLIGYDYDSLLTELTITENITKGLTYRFRYRCRNTNGWSAWSDETYI